MDNAAPGKARRSDSTAQPENASNAAEDLDRSAADAGGPGNVASGAELRADNIISVCAWCPEVHVLKLDRKPGDIFLFAVDEEGKLETVYRKRVGARAEFLRISDGICPACSARLKR